ncbi:hypothetical protein CAL26_02735 [Bordetella genomosp. 9]|uniref:Uncharacterized protein n=2 Tax=Bordetella genomosp. 9 TaxID=1416803 RepID=A0A261RQF5_9BORD|nr:hypothetical protein CAL26_02735 [Bordetella genomosp. 9]
MGIGRARHRALGILAVMAQPCSCSGARGESDRDAGARMPGARLAIAACLLAVALTGCSSIGGFTGAAAGIATGAATSNPAIGVGVGVAVKAATDAAVQRVYRNMQDTEQTLIARAAGTMAPGEKRVWAAHYSISFFDEHGELQVLNQTENALTTCRDVAFSVVTGEAETATSQWFVTQVCRNSDQQWRWAAAEPAVGRWGSLQ